MRILLVDDDPVFCDLLRASLSEHGFQDVFVSHSAQKALTQVANAGAPFDCFLLDIMMEEMDGVELCAALRQRAESRAAPIIMLTGSTAKRHMARAFEAGATDFLKKPLDVVDMVGRINAAMMLVEATKQEKRGRMALRAVIKYASEFDFIDLKERICFQEIRGMVDIFQIENELLRLDPGYHSIGLFSIRIRLFQSLFRGKDRGYVVQLLHEISTTISDTIAKLEFRFSYVGYGKYEVILYNAQPDDMHGIASRLSKSLDLTLANLSFIWSEKIGIEVTTLSQRESMRRDEILENLQSEFEQASKHDSFILPEIKVIEDKLFDQIELIENELRTR